MTRTEIRAYGRTLGAAAALVAVILGAQGLVDRIERDQEDRLRYQRWVADACTPGPHQRVVADHDGHRVRCTIYSRSRDGRYDRVFSAAVLEAPL